uniref:Uncharacterized protein n=1 Tax=Nonomuraea gerenzanensis TaxID=93944 RepID=A0A1M4EFK2_9ACTN|nr:hypothetical protein BN4615_P6954 [Nonomuraea gerenzanensis]
MAAGVRAGRAPDLASPPARAHRVLGDDVENLGAEQRWPWPWVSASLRDPSGRGGPGRVNAGRAARCCGGR